ncbi:hypothetical protein C8J57DRAFT_1478728, partial [Mycena rebaudengoi]
MPSRALTCWCRGQLWADSDTSTSRNNPVIIGWPFLVIASAFLVTGSGAYRMGMQNSLLAI